MTQGGSSLSGRTAATIGNWLSDREYETVRLLERATLVIEAHPGRDEVDELCAAYAQYASRISGPSLSAGTALVRKYPALTLLIMVMHASEESRASDFWESFWKRLGIQRESKAETELRQAVPKLIRRFNLADYPRMRTRYVQLIGMHAGIPRPSLPGLVSVIVDHLTRGGEPNGAAFTHWLTDPRKPHRLSRVDIPVRTFVSEGGEPAIDLIDRIIDVVAIALGNPATWQSHIDSIAATSSLPKELFSALVDAIETCDAIAVGETGLFDGDGHIEPPRMRLDTTDGSIQLLVPAAPDQRDSRWVVSADGDVTEVSTPQPLVSADGNSMSSPHAIYPVLQPARHISAEHVSIPKRFVFPLVDPKDPLVLFSDGGKLLPLRLPIPLGNVHALVPRGHHLVEGDTGTPINVDVDRGHPVGWGDWHLYVVDTTEVASLQLVKDGVAVGSARPVRRTYIPEVLFADAIRGVCAANGSPLYSERPAVWLPADSVGRKVQWQVGVRRLGSPNWVVNYVWTLEGDDVSCDPFDGLDDAQLGTFEVVVRGPLGSDLRKVFHLAEGITAEADPDYRIPVKGGLSNATITVTCDREAGEVLTIDPPVIDVSGDDAESIATIGDSNGLHVVVVISPPHTEVRLGIPGEPNRWSTLPFVITPSDLDSERVLSYRVPATTDINTWVEMRDRTGKVRLQEPPEYNEFADAFEVNTKSLAGGMGRLKSARIVAVVQTEGEAPHDIHLVTVRPAELFSDMRLTEDGVVLDDLADVAGLTVQVWATSAPWMAPASIPIRDDVAELPVEFRNAGPLNVRVVVQDPHNPVPVPAAPPSDSVRIEQEGWVRSDDPALEALAQFIAGQAELPSGLTPTPQVWAALQALTALGDSLADVRHGLAAMLSEQPRQALTALAHSAVPMSEQPALLIETGLVKAKFAGGDEESAGANPWVACLITLADLVDAERNSDQWVHAREELSEHGGDALIRVLDAGRDQELAKALFDHTTVMLHHMPAEQVDKIFDVARIIPGAVLDVDTRVSAIAETFAMRNRWVDMPSHTELVVRSKKFVRAIKKAGKQFYDQISIRSDALGTADTQSHPWLMLPMVSLIMALLARLEAHGAVKPGLFDDDIIAAWADMAKLCPQLVRIDLVFAEALIMHSVTVLGVKWGAEKSGAEKVGAEKSGAE
ncbi:hypothetical protein IEU95_02910 [Hoyosella rhizosphaerae]|uniref:Uncharacterized protein n=1 Tax=Hoyosella rhizosphaerae TaxID=1755582 RepID=A0A916UD37_9ACTN|nr:hypothetical protein [Hoyosella rhizosphaerae]MBN4925765.1 hypothetical protein [Hoyosella rhizosphaerae]GGC68128.1 hypothetical protein GCM10011410_21060 [Hoyosella rhizosphaerae]